MVFSRDLIDAIAAQREGTFVDRYRSAATSAGPRACVEFVLACNGYARDVWPIQKLVLAVIDHALVTRSKDNGGPTREVACRRCARPTWWTGERYEHADESPACIDPFADYERIQR